MSDPTVTPLTSTKCFSPPEAKAAKLLSTALHKNKSLTCDEQPSGDREFTTVYRSLSAHRTCHRPIGYVRLHGRNYDQWFDSDNRNDRYNYLYNERELTGWKDRIANVAERAQTTYVITNNHFESKAGVNALELKAMVTGKRVAAPPTLLQKYPELRRFADPADDSDTASPGNQLPLLA